MFLIGNLQKLFPSLSVTSCRELRQSFLHFISMIIVSLLLFIFVIHLLVTIDISFGEKNVCILIENVTRTPPSFYHLIQNIFNDQTSFFLLTNLSNLARPEENRHTKDSLKFWMWYGRLPRRTVGRLTNQSERKWCFMVTKSFLISQNGSGADECNRFLNKKLATTHLIYEGDLYRRPWMAISNPQGTGTEGMRRMPKHRQVSAAFQIELPSKTFPLFRVLNKSLDLYALLPLLTLKIWHLKSLFFLLVLISHYGNIRHALNELILIETEILPRWNLNRGLKDVFVYMFILLLI